MATGLSAEEAITAISGVTKRIAEQGRSAADTRAVMEQVVQSFSTGKAVMYDFRTLMRLMPRLWEDSSNALGTKVRSTEEFNKAAAAAGGHTKALLAVLGEMDRVSPGANLDTLRAQLDILRDLSQVLAAELGEHLVPAIVAVLKQVNLWIDRFRTMDDWAQKAIAWAAALATALTGLATVVGVATLGFGALAASFSALTGATGIAAVTAGIGSLVTMFAAMAPYLAAGGIVVGGLALLVKAIHDTSEAAHVLRVEITELDKVMQVYNLTTGKLETLTTAQATAYQNFQERVKTAQTEVNTLSTRLAENRAEQAKLNEALEKISSANAFVVLKKDLDDVIAKEQALVAELKTAEETLSGLSFEVSTETSTEPLENLEAQLVRAVDHVLRLRDAFGEVSRSGDIEAIQQAASELTAALKRELELQLKDSELTASERLDLELSHARDVENVNRDVQQRIAKITEETAKAREKADADAAKASQRRTDARIKEAERVRAVEVKEFERAARSGKAYADQLRELTTLGARRDFQALVETFQEQGLSLEAAREKAGRYIGILNAVNLNSAEQEFGDFNSTLKRDTDESADSVYNLIRGVRALGSAIANELPDTAGSLERALENERRYFEQNPIGITLGDIQVEAGQQGRDYVKKLFQQQQEESDAFNQYLKDNAVRLGTELASQAIRTAGELKRIEQDRVESLEDLEREYSEKIIAINEEKARKLGEIEARIAQARLERIAAIQTAFETAAAAEVAAREQVAEQILQIEARANAERQRLRERLTDRLVDLETQRDERIQDLQDGLTEREQERQQQILDITEKAAADRAAAEAQYAETVRSINDKLVEDVLAVQQELAENIEGLQSGLADREQARQTRILEITEQAAADRAAAERTYTDTLQGIYNDVVQQWDALEDGFTQRTAERAEERIAIEQDAAQARIDAYKDYEDSVSDIATELVDTVRDIQDKITEVVEDAAAERLQIQEEALTERRDLEQQYQDDIAQIESQRDADIQAQQERIVQIQRDADAARLAADQDYADRYQDIQNSLVDTVRDIQADITEVSAEAAAERLQIESDANAEARADFEAYQDEIAGIEAARITDVAQQEARLADRIQDIQNNLVDRVVDIQRDLTDTLADLRQQELDTEQDRLDSLVELHADSQKRIEDIERKGAQTQADIRREYHRDVQDAQLQLERALADADSDEDREQAQERFNRRVQDIGIENRRDYEDLAVRQEREREAVLRRQAEQEIAIAESAAARLAEIESQKAEAQAAARTGIAEAETQAGVTFGEAQANYVAALSETEQALADVNAKIVEITDAAFHETAEAALALKDSLSELAIQRHRTPVSALQGKRQETQVADLQGQITGAESRAGVTFGEAQENYVAALSESEQAAADHAEALKTIAENTESDIGEVNAKIVEITDAAFTETAEAALALKDSLSALDVETQNALSALTQRTGETVGGLQGQITDAEATAGVSFQAALTRYTPAVDLNTQALNTLNATLADITATETTGLTQLAAAGVADRAETTAAQQVLLAEAGVSLDAARAGYVPALSAAAQATLTLNETIRDLDTGLQEALTAINVEGQLDRQTTAENIQTAIANALAQQLELEGQAGLTFAEASLAFQPGVSDLTQAGIDRDTALSGIDTAEQEGLAEVNAQSIADRLATDAEITAARDAYIQARDQAIFEHNTAIRELGVKEAADIATIKETLKVDLAGIQTTLTAELEEIRDQKVLFDAKMNELITAVNAEANQDVSALKQDTAAMRSELEAIAEEARNNAWKQGILKIANVGITVAGVAVGAAVGGPAGAALGGQIGGAIGGLVEQGGNELFHFEQTDAIAYRHAQSAGRYFPTQDQLRNASDVSKHIVAGFTEGLSQSQGSILSANHIDITANRVTLGTQSLVEELERKLAQPPVSEVPIASGTPWDPYADRLTMGDVLAPGEAAANYAASYGRYLRDPLNFLTDQEGYDRGLTAEEGIAKLTDGIGTRISDVVQGLLAYQNTKDERLLTLLSQLAQPFGSSHENQTLATLFRNAGLAYLSEPAPRSTLFHFEETDAIARRLARQAAYREPRQAPDYLPTPTQLRNAQDVGREVVAGVMEGFAQKDAATQVTPATGFDGTQEIQATLHYRVWTDGAH